MPPFPTKQKTIQIDGLAIAIRIIRGFKGPVKQKVLTALAKKSPAIAKVAFECEFLYQDLPLLEAKSLTRALHSIRPQLWHHAWKITPPSIQSVLLEHMSERSQADFLHTVQESPTIPKLSAKRAQSVIAKTILNGLRSGLYHLKDQR